MPKRKKLTEDEVQSLVGRLLQEARTFTEEELDGDRALLTNYYFGRPFGNEEDGRSKIVVPEVRNVVQAILPSLMRVFLGPEQVNEFKPRGPEDVEGAKQATDYINFVFMDDNPGAMLLHAAFKDSLVRRLGIMKWWWETEEREGHALLTHLTEDQLLLLQNDSHVDVEIVAGSMDPELGVPVYDVEVEYRRTGILRVTTIPPEEFLFNRSARDRDEAALVAHSRYMPVEDAIALLADVADEETVRDAASSGESGAGTNLDTESAAARRFDRGFTFPEEEVDRVLVTEAFPYLDLGDGRARLYRVWALGDAYEVLDEPQPISHRPFALFCPDPEPHTLIGLCPADYVKDIQEIKSAVMRGTLDSLNLAIHQRTEVVEGQVNLNDAMNTEMGALVRVRAPGMMREIRHSFIGPDALAVMQYLDEDKENRTGISKAAAGLDADALQSSTKAAVAATLSAAQQHIELIARLFAEGGMKQLFKGLLMTVCENQNQARIIRLRNQFVEMDPRSWDANMDVRCNLALGAGTTEEKIQALFHIKSDQDQIMQTLGPTNPLVKLSQLRNTRARMVELIGFPDAAEFYQEIDPEQEKQMEQAAAQASSQQQPDPQAAAYVQAEYAKVQQRAQQAAIEAQLKQHELTLREQEMRMKDDLERDKIAAEQTLAMHKMELEHQAKLDAAQMTADMERFRLELEAGQRSQRQYERVERDEAGNVIAHEREQEG